MPFGLTYKFKYHVGYLLLLIFASKSVFSQLNASFTLNKESGCKPLSVQFTNTTTGAGANVVYNWNFGNGNTSVLQNPGATFIEEKAYSVTLTVTSDGNSSTFSKQLTVYKTPYVDFTASTTQGCMPLEVDFLAKATPGDGTISTYLWDFGDGRTVNGANMNAPKNNYTFAQVAPVSLTVTNSFGCFTTTTYGELIKVFQSVKAEFTINPIRTCTINDSVQFIPKNSVPVGTKWSWAFGDGDTSNLQSPKHSYGKAGEFVARLTAISPDGCSDQYQNTEPLQIADSKADFDLPAEACEPGRVKAINLSAKPFTSVKWFVNNNQIGDPLLNRDTTILLSSQGTYTFRLEVNYGSCKVQQEKKVVVHPRPLSPFPIAKRINTGCGAPATFEFTDTSKEITTRVWYDFYKEDTLSYEQSFTHTFQDGNGAFIQLWVTNIFGCKSEGSVVALFPVTKVEVITAPKYFGGCTKNPIDFIVGIGLSQDSIISYKWDFGDGKGTSTLKRPSYIYEKPGKYNVNLKWETNWGCQGVTTISVTVEELPKMDFFAPEGTTICGSTSINISPTNYERGFYTYLIAGKTYNAPSFSGTINAIIKDTGKYDVVLYYYTSNCIDTIIKKDYLTILPPFPDVRETLNTCNGNRGLITFIDSSKHVESWKWDFGDGNVRSYNRKQDTIQHHYKQSGAYRAILETSYGPCTLKQDVNVSVLLKQNPLISSREIISCANNPENIIIGPLEINVRARRSFNFKDYSIWELQYKDSTSINFEVNYSSHYFNTVNGYADFQFLNPAIGKFSFRYILLSSDFRCLDTTNFLNIELIGPKADFTFYPNDFCVREELKITDKSIPYEGTKIESWRWQMADNLQSYIDTIQYSTGNLTYPLREVRSGELFIGVQLTDSKGCTNGLDKMLTVSGPKSSFEVSSRIIALNTTLSFINTTDYTLDYDVSTYWIMPDGSTQHTQDANFTFDKEGFQTVKLINTNQLTGCSDTAVQIIEVRKVNARFTQSINYLNNNGCPPALAQFTSTSANAVRYKWNFGNGATGGNSKTASHTYNQPGIYQVWHYSYDINNNVDSSFDFIEIKGPYAIISANKYASCNDLQVTLKAQVKNANSYIWDFGDGTLDTNPQTQVTHRYLTAGIYTPSLILEDEAGCKTTSVLPEKIVVDSLNGNFFYSPDKICAETNVLLTAMPKSYSAKQLGSPISYRWDIPDESVTGKDSTFQHFFKIPGNYRTTLTMESPFGCSWVINKLITVHPPLNAAIQGPARICAGDTASFYASSSGSDVQFRWYIPGQSLSNTSVTPAIRWNSSGKFNIGVSLNNTVCSDSVGYLFTIDPIPNIVFNQTKSFICLGDSLEISISGNDKYIWNNYPDLLVTGNGQSLVWPAKNTWYSVQAISEVGCTKTDSIKISAIAPFTLVSQPNYDVCIGMPVNLTVSGANQYEWKPTIGLNNPTIANPVANLTDTRIYQVVGKDEFGCFTDTAKIKITINPKPEIVLTSDTAVLAGNQVRLMAEANMSGIIWNWNPSTYLNCTQCPNPVSLPLKNITYTVSAISLMGCAVTDSIVIKVLCSGNQMFIPSGFTPNSDGLNDHFGLLGGGFSKIRHFRVLNRWGNVVFERKNIDPSSSTSSWDGNYADGTKAPSGTYVYTAVVECIGGDEFSYKGTVTLIR